MLVTPVHDLPDTGDQRQRQQPGLEVCVGATGVSPCVLEGDLGVVHLLRQVRLLQPAKGVGVPEVARKVLR